MLASTTSGRSSRLRNASPAVSSSRVGAATTTTAARIHPLAIGPRLRRHCNGRLRHPAQLRRPSGVIAGVCRAEDGQAPPVRTALAVGAGGGVVWYLTGGMSCGGLPPRRCARHRFLPAAEDLDDAHCAAATGAWARKMSAISSFGRVTPTPGHSKLRFTVWSCNRASIS